MAIELVPLAQAKLTLNPPIVLPGTPRGTRLVGEITAMEWTGRINAKLKGVAAADWAVISTDNTSLAADVRCTIETDDGALIYVTYLGRANLATGIVISTPVFETGDPRYAWLNSVQAVAKATLAQGSFTYDVYEAK